MGQLEDMSTFVRIVDAGGITRASEQLRIAKSAISRRLVELEERLGTQLLIRTTRQSSLTDAGRDYYNRAITILEDVADLNGKISCSSGAALNGNLKISIPMSFGLLHLSRAILAFAEMHPSLTVQVSFEDRQVDLVEEGYDLGIRIAQLKDSTLIARKLLPIRTFLCASSAYLEKNGTPQKVEDLKNHDGLLYRQSSENNWKLFGPDGKSVIARPKIKMMANNGDFIRDAVIAGHGIALLPTFLILSELKSGQISSILTDFTGPELNTYAVYPQARHLSLKIRTFIDFLDRWLEENYQED
jgi:DNA-binding transcriptional LysR family regulator